MEEKTKSKKDWKTIVLFLMLGISLIAAAVFTVHKDIQKDDKIKALEDDLKNNISEKSSCLYLRDSLKRENARLYVYKTLTKAMVHRDEAVSQLKYGIGDVVILKVDSSRVVIQDVFIGGGKFEYYIKYSVMHKDRRIETVSPELVY
jgi:hypothetical protein